MSAERICDEHLNRLSLSGALEELRRQRGDANAVHLGFEERLTMLLQAQVDLRSERRRSRMIKEAGFRTDASLLEFRHGTERNISRAIIAELSSCGFVRRHQGLIVSGATGVGKTFLVCGIGAAAVDAGYPTRYVRLSRLFEEIALARADTTYRRVAAKLASWAVLIIDDMGLAPIPSRGSRELLDILDERIGKTSTIIASQLPLDALYRTFEDATVADAVFDRIVHSSIRVELTGESQRRLQANDELEHAE